MIGDIVCMMIPLGVLLILLAVGAYFADHVMPKYPKIQKALCRFLHIDEKLLDDTYIYENEV